LVYKTVAPLVGVIKMGSRRRKAAARPMSRARMTDGKCPKCTTIVKFKVSGDVGKEIYECTSCMSKFSIDEL
jgi:transposase-like protein